MFLQPRALRSYRLATIHLLHLIQHASTQDPAEVPGPPPPAGATPNPALASSSASQAAAATSTLPPASATSLPPNTKHGPGDGDNGQHDGLLNYYFLLIAVFIIAICIVYYTLVKRRRHQNLQSASLRQTALRRDLSSSDPSHYPSGSLSRPGASNPYRRFPGMDSYAPGRGPGGWRRWRPGLGSRDSGHRVEGLDERGEAPPPYVKEPEQVHTSGRASSVDEVELRDWRDGGQKPPDYEERRGAETGR